MDHGSFDACLTIINDELLTVANVAMAAFAVDGDGNRIKTDILVTGWIREIGKEHALLIPSDINGICFAYWLAKICDEWDKKYIKPVDSGDIQIDGQVLVRREKNKDYRVRSLYGCHVVDKGLYEWKIQFNTEVKWICIGIIKDNDAILEENWRSNQFFCGDGCFLINANGRFFHKGIGKNYCPSFQTKDTIITMTLNMDEHTLRYKINDNDRGIATDKLDQNAYRFVVCLGHNKEYVVELL